MLYVFSKCWLSSLPGNREPARASGESILEAEWGALAPLFSSGDQHPLRTQQECRTSGPTPDLLGQSLHLNKIPGHLWARSSRRSLLLA